MSDEENIKTDEPAKSLEKTQEGSSEPEFNNNANEAIITETLPDTAIDNEKTNQDINQTELDEIQNNDKTNADETNAVESAPVAVEQEEERPATPIKKKRHDEKPKMDADFYYDYESLIFQPIITQDGPFKTDFIQL